VIAVIRRCNSGSGGSGCVAVKKSALKENFQLLFN